MGTLTQMLKESLFNQNSNILNEAITIDKEGWYVIDYSNRTGKSIQLYFHKNGAAPLNDEYKEILFYSPNISQCMQYFEKLIMKNRNSDMTLMFGDMDYTYEE